MRTLTRMASMLGIVLLPCNLSIPLHAQSPAASQGAVAQSHAGSVAADANEDGQIPQRNSLRGSSADAWSISDEAEAGDVTPRSGAAFGSRYGASPSALRSGSSPPPSSASSRTSSSPRLSQAQSFSNEQPPARQMDSGAEPIVGTQRPDELPPPQGSGVSARAPAQFSPSTQNSSELPTSTMRAAGDMSAKEWLAELTVSPSGSELSGEPLTLGEAMDASLGRQRTESVVSAYWALSLAVAKYHVALGVQQSLGSTTNGPPIAGAGTQAAAEAKVALHRQQLEATQAQHRLARLLDWDQGRLPLPTSTPHVGSYKTRYDEIFANRVSRRAWELDQMLSLLYDLVKARAELLNRTEPDHASFSKLANDFLDSVGQYNLAIAEYALLATGDALSGRDLVPLLIRVDRGDQEQVIGQKPGEGRTSRHEPANSGRRRQSFADSQVVRVSGESSQNARQEQSVLAQPQASPRVAAIPTATEGSAHSSVTPGTSLTEVPPEERAQAEDQWRERTVQRR